MQDHQLMALFADDDYSAFEALYLRHKDMLYRYLLRQLTPALAEDLSQDIWLKVINARSTYKAEASFRTWLYTIANNRLKDHWRSQARQPIDDVRSSEDDEDLQSPSPELQAIGQQQGMTLLQLLHQLPEEQRTCFLLRHEAGLSFQQIATITDTNIEASKSRLRYAMTRLRSGLERIYDR